MISCILITGNSAPYRGLLPSSCGGLQPLAATEWPLGPEGDFAVQSETFEKPLKIKGFAYINIVIPLKVRGPTDKIFEMTKTFEMPLTN